MRDRGIFSDLDATVRLGVPRWLDRRATWILVDKQARVLTLYVGGDAVKSYPIALGFEPVRDKEREGDGRTPEGDFFITEALDRDLAAKYGARSLRLSYPNAEDAARGLRQKLITAAQAEAIVAAVQAGRQPPQTTPLGGSIRIHGGGVGRHWTAGCVALRDPDVSELYRFVGVGTRVRVLAARHARLPDDRDGDGIPDLADVAIGAKKTALNADAYTEGYFRMAFPGGDLPRHKGVCTDVIVRALRNAGFDLQALQQQDVRARRRAYPWITRPDGNIDHRRVRNLAVYFARHFRARSTGLDAATLLDWLPGDIVLLDTFPSKPGPDHIGIVSDTLGASGLPLVVNSWTVGARTGEMDLLAFVPVTHRFRVPATAAVPEQPSVGGLRR
ncbi:MAG: DUF1287 domain-containing protein [Deltaproteobacteria bacterium]|nr:DUF1287 domain-containing protein [Deltaproteobacteria bacterium]